MTKWGLVAVGLIGHELLARSLAIVPNYGISLGINFGYLLIMMVSGGIVVWCWKNQYYLLAVGGGINLVDRLRFGYVRDYWQIPLVGLYNNLADWIIWLGIILVGLRIWKQWK